MTDGTFSVPKNCTEHEVELSIAIPERIPPPCHLGMSIRLREVSRGNDSLPHTSISFARARSSKVTDVPISPSFK
jgi:hypothetical protein